MDHDEQSKQTQLDTIKQRIISDGICSELAATAQQLVFGAGSSNAELMFIGEAPGKNEDMQGLPFVGAAGKLLDEMLASIELDRNDVYITNIVKYRPPNNRDPLPAEKEAFLPYLWQQITVIEPKLIITLGRHSMECFLPDQRISQAHGKPKRIRVKQASGKLDRLIIMPLYHPAAALYNGGLRETLFTDFADIPTIIQSIETLTPTTTKEEK